MICSQWQGGHFNLFKLTAQTLLLPLLLKTCDGSNWAQTSGYLDQNVVITKIPSVENQHWSARYGHATAILLKDTAVDPNIGEIYLTGGDIYTNDTESFTRVGIMPFAESQGYMNDVWQGGLLNLRPGEENLQDVYSNFWETRSDVRLRGPKYPSVFNPMDDARHQKLPRTYSRMEWSRVKQGIVPNGIPYDDWIKCENYFDQPRYIEERRSCPEPVIVDEREVPGREVMWSPRRHHASVSLAVTLLRDKERDPNARPKEYLFVMGGRARELVDYAKEKSIGGIQYPRVRDPLEIAFSTQHEATVLKSDVWMSTDGKRWELVTPGCIAPQADLITAGRLREDGSRKYGQKKNKCKQDVDCFGAEICVTNERYWFEDGDTEEFG